MKKIVFKKARIFKIRNRKGYACVCLNCLTEGRTILQAYQRMIKALKRKGIELPEITSLQVKRLVKDL